jgi:hypothetical protein
MMHAVIRGGHDVLHLIGHVDAYNIESLRDHVTSMTRSGDVSLFIEVTSKDSRQLSSRAGGWLDHLAHQGVSVKVQEI